jgi:putative hydrolase of HD superfamily
VSRIVEFLFEVGMLKRTPRTGWQFLGSGAESVADHAYRAALITFVLSRLDGTADTDRAVLLALVHDLPEARTGDLNYMNQKYVAADEARAAADLTRGLPFGDELAGLLEEYRAEATPEAVLAHDADHLELLLSLKEERDAGNPQADEWMPFVVRRLRSPAARELAEQVLAGHSADWWFDRGSSWWVRGGKG